jgi:hypothetical protein
VDVLLVGGSNTGLRDGWARQFEKLATRHRVTNAFLGATGSLYGLVNLMAVSDLSKVDVVIFEYTLNDAIFVNYGVQDQQLIQICLEQVAAVCRANDIRLILLTLNRRDDFPVASEDTRLVNETYLSVAKAWGLEVVSLRDLISNHARIADCPIDSLFDGTGVHLSQSLAEIIAEAVLAAVQGRPQVTLDLPAPSRRHEIIYIPATTADLFGKTLFVDRRTAAFKGRFLRLAGDARCQFNGAGELIALLVNSRQESGWLTLETDDGACAKNTHSTWTRPGTDRIIMQYMTKKFGFRAPGLSIVRGRRSDRVDVTPETLDPTVADDAQVIELHGLVVLRAFTGEQDLNRRVKRPHSLITPDFPAEDQTEKQSRRMASLARSLLRIVARLARPAP